MRDDFTRYGVEPMMTLAEVRKVLGVSTHKLYVALRSGHLPVYNSSGLEVDRRCIGPDTGGLRVRPQDLREYIATLRVA